MLHAAALLVASGLALLAYVVRGGPRLPPDLDAILDEATRADLSHVVSGEVGHATSAGLRIWYERRCPPGATHGTVLLVSSMGGDALFWPPSFLRMFVHAGYCVVRFDHRGTGMSDWVEDWNRAAAYSLKDMAGDAVAALDALGVTTGPPRGALHGWHGRAGDRDPPPGPRGLPGAPLHLGERGRSEPPGPVDAARPRDGP